MLGIRSSWYVLVFTDLLAPSIDYTSNVVSEVDCALLCTNGDCASFFYDDGNRRCYLSSTIFGDSDSSLVAKAGVKCYENSNIGETIVTTTTTDAPTTTTTPFPPPGYTHDAAEHLWYNEVTTGTTWVLANQTCASQGARLPKILTAQRNDFYKQKRSALGTFWLGGSDIEVEGVYVWTDGSVIGGYTDWIWSNPDGGTSQNCMEMDSLSGATGWSNGGCDNNKNYVCEIETATSASTTTVAPTTTTTPFLPPGYTYDAAEHLWYNEVTTGTTWVLANQTCASQGARLPKILTAQRNDFYKQKRSALGTFWLGGSDIEVEGVYVWTDGSVIGGYTDWIWSNPDGGTSQNCMEMDSLSGATGWSNGGCDNNKNYVCEIIV